MPGLKLPLLVHYIISVKLNGCLWNSAQWLWTQYHRMMIITHCHALCGGCTFAYFTQVWQSAEWHYRSKQENLCNLISANKQPPWIQCCSVTVMVTLFFHFIVLFSFPHFYFPIHSVSRINVHLKSSSTSVQIDNARHCFTLCSLHYSVLQTHVQMTWRSFGFRSIWWALIMSSWGHPLWALSTDCSNHPVKVYHHFHSSVWRNGMDISNNG